MVAPCAGVMPLMEMRARRRAQLSGNSTPTRTGSPRPTQDDPAGMHVEVTSLLLPALPFTMLLHLLQCGDNWLTAACPCGGGLECTNHTALLLVPQATSM